MKRIGIIGAGRFGSELADSLVKGGAEVILMDRDMKVVERMAPVVAKAIQGDATDKEALEQAGFQTCDAVVVAIGVNMEGSVIATLNLRDMNVSNIICKAVSDAHGRILEKIGATLVMHPNKERAQRLARTLLSTSVLDYFEISENVSMVEMALPKEWAGRTIRRRHIRSRYSVLILAIKRRPGRDGRQEKIINPDPDTKLEEGDTIVVFGSNDKIRAITG